MYGPADTYCIKVLSIHLTIRTYTTGLRVQHTHSHPPKNATRWHWCCSHHDRRCSLLVGTAADNLASRWHCRCSRPTDRTGITIGEPEHEENCSADPTCAATAWNRTRPVDPRSHRCDCWTASPAAEAATPPGSKHRDAPAVKERERPLRPSCELEKICTQRVHGPPLADFAMRGKGKLCFFALGVSTRWHVFCRIVTQHNVSSALNCRALEYSIAWSARADTLL